MNKIKKLFVNPTNRKNILVFLFYTACISYAYLHIFQTYFLHDEWRQIAGIIEFGPIKQLAAVPVWQMLLGKGRILGTLINNMFYYFFPLQTTPFHLFAFLGHIVNAYLLYLVILRLTKNRTIAFFSGLFFAVSSRHLEAVSWIGASVELIGSMFFALLASNAFISYQKNRNKTYLFLFLLLWYISYLFKEQTIFLLPIAAIVLLYDFFKSRRISFWILFLILGISATAGLFGINRLFSFYVTNTHGFTGTLLLQKQLINVLFYPFVSLGQFFLPHRFIYRCAEWVMNTFYPFMNTGGNNETLIHFPLSDFVSCIVSTVILFGLLYIFLSNKKSRKPIIFTTLLYISSFFPIAFHLIHRYDTSIESRFMYIASPFVALLFGYIVWYVSRVVLKSKRLLSFVAIVIALVFLGKEMTVTRREVEVAAIQGREMTKFLYMLKKAIPVFPKDTILLIEGDKNYYVENNKLPFQLGAGYVLSVVYYKDGTIPLSSIKRTTYMEEPLVQFGSQGVVTDGSKTFGYYWDRDVLKKDVQDKQINIHQVRAFRYVSGDSTVEDITSEIHDFLSL